MYLLVYHKISTVFNYSDISIHLHSDDGSRCCQNKSRYTKIQNEDRGFIKGRALGKLTGCEDDFAPVDFSIPSIIDF